MNEKKRSRSIIILLVTVGVLLLLSAGACLVLMKQGILNTPALIEKLLKFQKADFQNEPSSEGIPEIHASEDNIWELFYDLKPAELLNTVTERSSYTRSIRVIYSYNGDHTAERYTIAKNGSCWRADSDERLLIWNGKELYLRDGEYEYPSESGEFNFFEEIGITPLNQIRQVAAEKDFQYSLSDDKKILKITINDEENGIRNDYEIAVESGVVLSESSYYRGSAFRTVITDSLEIFGADSLPDDYFAIP